MLGWHGRATGHQCNDQKYRNHPRRNHAFDRLSLLKIHPPSALKNLRFLDAGRLGEFFDQKELNNGPVTALLLLT
jgi:hypothetical protein